MELRKNCLLLVQELEELKRDYDEATESEPSDAQDESPSQTGGFVQYLTREEKQKIAEEVSRGNDVLFKQHMSAITDMFLVSKGLQKQREGLLRELAVLAQEFRDQQLKNSYLLENVDELLDKILEKRQHIEYVRKDIVVQRKRQLSYLAELFDLYKSRDAEIERLQLSVLMSAKEREYLEKRRDEAFNTLLDLMVERRRVLGIV